MDALGMLLSAFCALHCVALTALLVFSGPAAAFWRTGEDLTHVVMLTVVVPVSVVAFGGGWLRHRRADVVLLGATGALTLAAGALVAHERFGAGADAALSIAGGAMLALAHWRNRQRCACPAGATPA